jgi:hypothetical protein
MSTLHNSPVGCHSGAPVTLNKVRSLFFSPGMRKDILQIVQSCYVCLQAKPDRTRYPGLLEPLPVPDSAWEIIEMDFIEDLPMSDNANTILMVVENTPSLSISFLSGIHLLLPQ